MASLFLPKFKYIPEIFKKYGQKKDYQAGEILFNKNDLAYYMYYIIEGRIRAFLPYADGNERTLCYFTDKYLAGEEIFAAPYKRIACCSADTDVKTYRITADTFLTHCMQNREALNEFMAFFIKKITQLHSWNFYSQFIKNDEKIACLLYSSTTKNNESVQLTHEQIAAVTGMNRVTATRILNSFAKEKLISKEYKSICVLNREGLKPIFANKEFY